MLFIKSIQGNAIRTLFEVLKEIVHDVCLRVDDTGIKLRTMDGARCAMVYLRLRRESFEEFRCDGPLALGLNMSSVFKLVKTCGPHDTITFHMDSQYCDCLGIRIENSEKNKVTDYRLKLLDVDEHIIKTPDVEFDSVITMPSQDFQKLCRDMQIIGDTMCIRSEGSRLVLSCDGDFASQETVIGEATEGMTMCSKTDKTVEARYNLKYLVLFCKAANLSNTLELFLKESYPLILKYNVASLGEMRFCVAPKID
jgi:proliferating cell nuclear antigen